MCKYFGSKMAMLVSPAFNNVQNNKYICLVKNIIVGPTIKGTYLYLSNKKRIRITNLCQYF